MPDSRSPMQSNPKTAAEARDASTIIVLRDARPGFEVFMVRRHQKSGFMANAYVYPGGQLDAADCTEDAAARVEGLSPEQAARKLGAPIAPLKALGLYLAGVRETFEEAGILLARRTGEQRLIDLKSDTKVNERFTSYRDDLHDGRLALSELARAEDLVIPLENMGYFAHWITPYIEHRRYDTYFFVALAPRSQRPVHDKVETTDSLWIRPGEALDLYREGGFFLAPPTLRTLEQLTNFETVDAVLAFADDYHPPTILPHFEQQDGELALLLPGDPDYPHGDPAYAMATPVDDGVTRMWLRDGLWVSAKE